jgi:hypothetical protein
VIVGDIVEGRESLEVWFHTSPSELVLDQRTKSWRVEVLFANYRGCCVAGTTSVHLPRPACDDRKPGKEVLTDLKGWA